MAAMGGCDELSSVSTVAVTVETDDATQARRS
jgi:hypothetical protein